METSWPNDDFGPITSWLHKWKREIDLIHGPAADEQIQQFKDKQEKIWKANRQWYHQVKYIFDG